MNDRELLRHKRMRIIRGKPRKEMIARMKIERGETIARGEYIRVYRGV
jgi:hypothetical protein